MSEKRRSKRSELTSKLMMNRIDSAESGREVEIDVQNVSKTGIGFSCDSLLEIGAVYEGFLRIWTKEIIHAFIEVVRIEKKDNTFSYGGLFVGMPESESCRISVYQTINEEEDM